MSYARRSLRVLGRSAIRSLARSGTALALVVAATIASASLAQAQAGKTALNVDDNGVILHGFDAVSYQTAAAPVRGTASYTATHEGAIYHFASAANRDVFKANPARYAPAYGGYCAMGVAVGKKLDGDPAAYTVFNGTLYLNVNPKVRGMWAADMAGNEVKARKNWAEVQRHAGFDTM